MKEFAYVLLMYLLPTFVVIYVLFNGYPSDAITLPVIAVLTTFTLLFIGKEIKNELNK